MDGQRGNGRGGYQGRGNGRGTPRGTNRGSSSYRGRGGYRGAHHNAAIVPREIVPQEIDESWRGGSALDRAFEDIMDLMNTAGITISSAPVRTPLKAIRWHIPRQMYNGSKFAKNRPADITLQLPSWKYPQVIPVDSIKPLAEGSEYPGVDEVAILSAESALWDLFERTLGQYNRNQSVVIAVSANGAEYVDKVIAGRMRVFGATSVSPEKIITRVHPWDRSGVRGVYNTVLKEDTKTRVDLVISVGDTASAVRVMILSAVVLKATGIIVRLVSMDALLASCIHTASMFFADVNIIRYSDGSSWFYASGRAMLPEVYGPGIVAVPSKPQPMLATTKTMLYDALQLSAAFARVGCPDRNCTFLSADELTGPEFAETVGILIDSIDGVGGDPVDTIGWAVKTRWEYFR